MQAFSVRNLLYIRPLARILQLEESEEIMELGGMMTMAYLGFCNGAIPRDLGDGGLPAGSRGGAFIGCLEDEVSLMLTMFCELV